MTMPKETDRISRIFARAEKDKRNSLFEQEVYELLRACGIATPRFVFIPRGRRVSRKDLAALGSSEVVLKVVSPRILHKSDVGGVAFVPNTVSAVSAAIGAMMSQVPPRFAEWWEKFNPPSGLSVRDIAAEIRGVLIVERIQPEDVGFGSDLLLGIRNSREFGPVVTMGLGGLDVEYVNERLKEGRALAIGAAHLMRRAEVDAALSPLAVYDKLVGGYRGKAAPVAGAVLSDVFERFLKLGRRFSPLVRESPFVIEEAEVNPFVIRRGTLVPLDGLCRFSRRHLRRRPSIHAQIDHLLRPGSIGIIGVSERMNLGHIILKNILREGFPSERVYVVKPGLAEIEGCRCVPEVRDLPETVDLFVLTLAADQSPAVIEALVTFEKARSVIIIASGMGEKAGTEVLEENIKGLLSWGRDTGKLTPVVNGGNCMGIYSAPGKYDTTFIPGYKLASPGKTNPRLVYISQSGAFMASRMSKLPQVEPLCAISLGNQLDLTASDYLNYFLSRDDAALYALYIEGFVPGDGLALARAAREIVKRGKCVVAYKSGRSSEGRRATAGHTASVAGDYAVCCAVLESAGVFLAETLAEFEDALRVLPDLAGKRFAGRRVAVASNAGFECVILADGLKNESGLELARFSKKTAADLAGLLHPLGIDRLQDVRNPLDLTPVADDATFAGSIDIVLKDAGVDCAVVSVVPMTAALQTLPPGPDHAENIYDPKSLGRRLIEILARSTKPAVVNIDAGPLYDPLARLLEEAGLAVFRRSDEALRFLGKLVSVRRRAAGLK
jgi:acyl-CoA synthetase (NDP forming)